MGGLAERKNVILAAGSRYKENRVMVAEDKNVTASGMAAPTRLLSYEVLEQVRSVRGVRKVVPQVMISLDPLDAIPMGTAKMVLGGFMGSDMKGEWRFAEGRAFSETDRSVAVLGSDLVKRFDAKIGKRITLRGHQFTVVGILDKTLNSLDASVFVPLTDARQLYLESLPESFRRAVKPEELLVTVTVYPATGQDTDKLAQRINDQVEGVIATGPSAWRKQVGGLGGLLDAVAFAMMAIALFAGGLLVMNSMMMAVTERTREVGIQRAMGASTGRVARQFLVEALVIGLLGGIVGLALGAAAIWALNWLTGWAGLVLFALTPRLAAEALVFSALLSQFAGVYPAVHAARLSPVKALAYE